MARAGLFQFWIQFLMAVRMMISPSMSITMERIPLSTLYPRRCLIQIYVLDHPVTGIVDGHIQIGKRNQTGEHVSSLVRDLEDDGRSDDQSDRGHELIGYPEEGPDGTDITREEQISHRRQARALAKMFPGIQSTTLQRFVECTPKSWIK